MTTRPDDYPTKNELLAQARQRIPNVPVLINAVSKRVKQLTAGHRPLVKPLYPGEDRDAIALREIADGKLIVEIDFSAVPQMSGTQ